MWRAVFMAATPLSCIVVAGLAHERGVGLGAHPGFNDLWGFGRRPIQMNARDIEYLVAYQIGALQGLAAYSGAKIRHVKPHGALYNMAAKDESYARAIARAVRTIDKGLIFVGLPNTELQKAAESEGLAFAREGFCDRRYNDDGSLMARSARVRFSVTPRRRQLKLSALLATERSFRPLGQFLKHRLTRSVFTGTSPAQSKLPAPCGRLSKRRASSCRPCGPRDAENSLRVFPCSRLRLGAKDHINPGKSQKK